ncbi:MAG TPA: hypothetical protein VF715_03255 [Thermoleophilaceae bacterium]|jgi:hypothetical protein
MPGANDVAYFLCQFGESESPERARANALLHHIVEPTAAIHDLAVERADLATRPGRLTPQVFESLLSSTVAICDLSGSSPNVFYELGVLHASNFPVILMIDDPTGLPFYVKDENLIVTGAFTGTEPDSSLIARISAQLSRALGHVLAEDYVPTSIVGEITGLAGPFPPALRQAVREASLPLYRDDLRYDFKVTDVSSEALTVRLGLNYRLVNATRSTHLHTVGLVPMRPLAMQYARIGSREPSPDDNVTVRGWQVQQEFPPRSSTAVTLVADVSYRLPDTDVFATYLPATKFELYVNYPADILQVYAESLLPDRVDPERLAPGVLRYCPRRAVLSYHGFKLDWLPRKE